MPPRKREDKEIEGLKARRRKAQQKNDIAEEAKLCNAIGVVYMRKGSYERALHYHQTELGLSEALADALGTAIAHRKVGECLCELGDYEQAIQHQRQHLKISRNIGDLVEEQRALATLGRTYFVQLSMGVGEEEARELRVQAGNANLKSLDVCDKLSGTVPDRELLEMRSRLYLNLGLVYENGGDLHSARKFMEKALSIARELDDSATVLQCHLGMGSLYLRENRPALALRSLREALGVASELHSWQQEAEILREMSQAQLLMSNFDEAKTCLKKAVRLLQENSQLAETEADQKKLNAVRKVVHYSLEMEALGGGRAGEKMRMCEKLGDLCCLIKACPAAIKFYEQQLGLAEAHGVEPKDLSPILISLARTHTDCRQFPEALLYYEKELELKRGSPSDECDTWTSIATARDGAGLERQTVMEAFDCAFKCAGENRVAKLKIDVCRAVVRFCKLRKSSYGSEQAKWEGRLEDLLKEHPDVPDSGSEESDSDFQEVERECGFVTPDSLSEMESVEEEEEEREGEDEAVETTSGRRGVAVRRKARLFRRNEKGETLLHVAAISGNLAAARQLILEGADVNARDNCGWMPLHEACNHGQLELVACLLDSGADVNDPGGVHCGGVTPLIDSANNGHLDIVRLLVQRGADLFLKDAKGNTAVDLLTERLASTEESSGSYEMEDEHTAIRDYLVEEMKKRGWTGEPSAAVERRGGVGRRRRSLSISRSSEDLTGRGGVASGKQLQRRAVADRTGRGVLLSDDEDDGAPPISVLPKSPHHKRETASTSGGSLNPSTSRELSTSTRSLVKLSSRDSSCKTRQLKRPFVQEDRPALISPERAESSLITGAFPIIDHWLEDDVGRPQLKKRKATDPFVTHTQSSSSPTGMTRPLSLKSRSGVGKTRSQERILYSSASTVERSSRVMAGPSNSARDWAVGGGGLPREAPEVVTINSSPDHQLQHTVTGHTPHTSHTSPPQSTATERATPTAQPAPLPLRIRVKIEARSYLVPCHARLTDGSESTIQWLATQAAERYYTQHGVRPRLSLSTSDGALLCPSDVVGHVLQTGEEVVGEVKHWHLPPLPERYQTACSSSGLECHRKVLELLQGSSSLSVLDLSHLSLQPAHLPPLLSSLRSHAPLISLSLCGNRLKTEGLSLLAGALSLHPNLRVLDLSCTGLTPQGLEILCNPPSSQSSSHHHHPPIPTPTPGCKPWSSVRELLLGHNPLGAGCGPALSSLFSLTPGLLELQLQSCGLEGRTLERHTGLGHTLKGLSNLTEVVVSLNPLGCGGVVSLLQSLPTGRLSSLDLANCSTRQPLTPALEEPKVTDFFSQVCLRLTRLNLSHCPVDMLALARLLEDCQHLQELRLAAVGLSVDSLHPLCRLVSCSRCLRLLDVSGNEGVANEGCLQLLRCSETETASRDLKIDLRSCGIRSPLSSELSETLSHLLAKRKIEIAGNSINYLSLFPTKDT